MMRDQWVSALFRKFRKPRFAVVYALAVLVIYYAHTTALTFQIGIVVAALGELVRLWANGYVGHVKVNRTDAARSAPKIGRLITAGPYAFVRHPLYLGTLLIAAGTFIIVGNWWLGLISLASLVIIYRRKMAEEETRIQSEWGEAYARYHQSVSRWLPLRRRYAHAEGCWSWQGIVASKEWKTAIWIIVLIIGLYLRQEIWQEHRVPLSGLWGAHPFLISLAVLLVAADGLMELARRFVLLRSPPLAPPEPPV